jgi:hypothetical protein
MIKNKVFTILSALFILGFTLILSAWAVNYYIYSWRGYINIHFGIFGRCIGKQIGLSNPNNYSSGSTEYLNGKSLGELLDLNKLAVRANSNYEVSLVENYSLSLGRNFNGKKYTIFLRNKINSETTFRLLGGLSDETEECTAPDYRILQNAYKMIDDLPLTDAQKQKIKDNVVVEGIGSSFVG